METLTLPAYPGECRTLARRARGIVPDYFNNTDLPPRRKRAVDPDGRRPVPSWVGGTDLSGIRRRGLTFT